MTFDFLKKLFARKPKPSYDTKEAAERIAKVASLQHAFKNGMLWCLVIHKDGMNFPLVATGENIRALLLFT